MRKRWARMTFVVRWPQWRQRRQHLHHWHHIEGAGNCSQRFPRLQESQGRDDAEDVWHANQAETEVGIGGQWHHTRLPKDQELPHLIRRAGNGGVMPAATRPRA